jgi:hypothetical protein
MRTIHPAHLTLRDFIALIEVRFNITLQRESVRSKLPIFFLFLLLRSCQRKDPSPQSNITLRNILHFVMARRFFLSIHSVWNTTAY